ncbi:hypothetical protein [Thiocapsa marina]|uniref:Uncharacterized protein n=1 Tax=Thiocapsa marina 5811 TaxID=768671 RepID=F9UGR5_9GAMM|nr:hypothetical protein [Thiocapsa marina]EGV16535.1 hypothetical protein ThimaDRAFT_4118 [Thiocapsa marina 5811]
MKYAAKRTWPDKPKSWEAKGEAETPEAFALEFAADQGLGLGTELVVIEREGEDAEIQFFKIANTSPYQLAQAEPRAGSKSVRTFRVKGTQACFVEVVGATRCAPRSISAAQLLILTTELKPWLSKQAFRV